MKKPFPRQLFYWLIIRGGLLFAVVLLLLLVCLWTLGFKSYKDFLLGFLFASFALFPVFYILFQWLLETVGHLMEKINRLTKGQSLAEEQESFVNEIGEFYDINKALGQLQKHLSRQKRIISRESSELEAVISTLSSAIVAVDQAQKILFFNTPAALLFDQRSRAKKQDLFLSELVRNPDVLKCFQKSLKEGEPVKRKLPLDLVGQGQMRDYEITVVPLKESRSLVQGAVGLFYDITNITKTEKLHVDFISNVSHELRTPLTAIQGYVQTLQMELKESKDLKKMASFLRIIDRNVQRLVSLLSHFLELAQMESHIDLKKEELSTEEITRSIIQDLHIEGHKLKLDFSAKEVTADKHFLKQVLYNLIDNAIRYVPKGRLIEILWRKVPEAVVLTVKDQGEGIPRKHRERLFERFYRVDPARKSAKGVSGVGLAIVKQLVEKHGGSIKLGAQNRTGSEFICTFPDK